MKALKYFLLILLVIYALFTLIAPALVDASKNKVISHNTNPSERATRLVLSLDFIGDLHSDALLWDRKLHKEYYYGHVDFPRMRKGNAAFQAFTIVTKSPKGQNFDSNSAESTDMITALSIGKGDPLHTWFSLLNRALYQCKKLHRHSKKSKEKVLVIKSKKDFEELLADRAGGKKTIGGMLGIEGGHCLEGKIENFQKLYDAGVRMLGPTHFFDNEMGGSAHGLRKEGLTTFGFEVMKKMQEKNMIMDLAHSSEKIVDQVLQNYSGPILTSHTGVDGTYSSLRNLSDRHLRGLAAKGGLVGIAYFPGAIGDEGVMGIVKAMKYTRDLIGIEHVALGSDFDGSVTTPIDVTGLPVIVDEMLRQGFSEGEIEAVLGGNLKRFLLKWL